MSLRAALFRRTFALIALLVLLVSSTLLFFLYQRYHLAAQHRAEAYAVFLAGQCVKPVLWDDRLQLKALFGATKEKEVAAYVWLEREGVVLAHTFAQGMPKGLLELRRQENKDTGIVAWQDQNGHRFQDISVPLPVPANGVLHLGIAKQLVDKAFINMLPVTVGIILISLLLGAALSWHMANAITVETRRANHELAASELKYHTLADNTADWEFWIGPEGEAIYNSPSCERIIGYTADELAADLSLFAGIIHPDDLHRFSAHRHTASQDQMVDELEVRIIRKDGEVCWLSHRCRPVFSERGEYLGTRGANTDITRRKQTEEEIKRLAFYDPLTDLPNRRLMLDRLQQAKTASARSARHGALLFIDLDNFKTLNDTLGHDVGDLLLQQVGQRLVSCVREGDTVARLGGDEFVLILEDLSRDSQEAHSQVNTVGEKILGTLNTTYQLAGYEYHNTPSIGVALFIGHEHTVNELLKRADIAMYQAKTAGRNTLRFFDLETAADTHLGGLVS